ncbi:hypothetical protein [Salinicoccus halodurans]|uniref:hypothetical protein n=1 Tax=Salinicoccus halodurans TaxID=407035 RepID=UPI0011874777|nr:hypothetical protein [Salinicoccus halodurans]
MGRRFVVGRGWDKRFIWTSSSQRRPDTPAYGRRRHDEGRIHRHMDVVVTTKAGYTGIWTSSPQRRPDNASYGRRRHNEGRITLHMDVVATTKGGYTGIWTSSPQRRPDTLAYGRRRHNFTLCPTQKHPHPVRDEGAAVRILFLFFIFFQ